jgi:hypothetical protein
MLAICEPLRYAVTAEQSTLRKGILENAVLALDNFITRWKSKNPKIDNNVLEAISLRREGIHSLLNIMADEPRLPTLIYEQFLALENIPSQIAAAIEQNRLERGLVPTRYSLLNHLAEIVSAQNYLEIGCCRNDCFNAISCPQKVGVDPISGGTLRMTSDEFFQFNAQIFDLIFIDGLHESWQVDKDIEHALHWSSPQALIVLHDCNPLFEVRSLVPRLTETWNGDVWKSLVRIRSREDLDCATGMFDHGCAVICKRPNSAPINSVPDNALSWSNLVMNRKSWIRPMSYNELITWVTASSSSPINH